MGKLKGNIFNLFLSMIKCPSPTIKKKLNFFKLECFEKLTHFFTTDIFFKAQYSEFKKV